MRVTALQVKQIIDTSLDDTIVDAYITGANALVNKVLGTGTSAILTQIELWLTAHLMAISKERQAKKEGAGGAFIEYTGNFGEGLRSTTYGQMVLSLDTTNAFAALGGRAATVFAIPQFED